MNYTVTCLEVAFMIVLLGAAFKRGHLKAFLNVHFGRRIYLYMSAPMNGETVPTPDCRELELPSVSFSSGYEEVKKLRNRCILAITEHGIYCH